MSILLSPQHSERINSLLVLHASCIPIQVCTDAFFINYCVLTQCDRPCVFIEPTACASAGYLDNIYVIIYQFNLLLYKSSKKRTLLMELYWKKEENKYIFFIFCIPSHHVISQSIIFQRCSLLSLREHERNQEIKLASRSLSPVFVTRMLKRDSSAGAACLGSERR